MLLTNSFFLSNMLHLEICFNEEGWLLSTQFADVPPKKLSFRFRISLSDMTNYKSADF